MPALLAFASTPALAQESKKLLERISGSKIPGDHPLLVQMEEKLAQGDRLGAARIALQHPNFYNITVKQMALKLSTRELTIAQKLNDFAASYIGVVKDGLDARLLLTGNFHYAAAAGVVASQDVTRSNAHYEQLDDAAGQRRINLASVLTRVNGQLLAAESGGGNVANPDPAGVLTSRAFLGAHAIAGTNRRPVEYTMKVFMCVDMAEWSDTGSSDARVGRDIDRMPGGDPGRYLTTCKGCHTGMDGFRGAFARWDWTPEGFIIHSSTHTDSRFDRFVGGISKKMNHNNTTYPTGHVTSSSQWVNFARAPANAALFGWRGTSAAVVDKGFDVKSFGNLVANSERFSQCMVKRVFEAVCRKETQIASNPGYFQAYATLFEKSVYNMQELFAQVAISPECNQ
ncbi:MAG: hypothetical protein KF767_07520 [Bdellovibrionaceae bacterium]|nr:hypothetical protein [Pseudobdellovibrionaceae bacterium]